MRPLPLAACLLLLACTTAARDPAPRAARVAPAASSTDDAAAPTPLRLMDVFELEWVSDPRISADGSRIAFARHGMDVRTDRRTSRLWIVSTEYGAEPRPLTEGEVDEGQPCWPTRGADVLAYVSVASGGAQIHKRWLDTGASVRLTHLPRSPGSLAWSPDGKWIAFTMFVPSRPEPFVELPSPPEGATWADPPIVIEELTYRADGAGYLEPGNTHVFVVSADGGTPRQLTTDDHDYGGPLAWTPDGASILVSGNRRDDHELEPVDSSLWELSVADGSLVQLTDRFGPEAHPVLSPDGERVAFLGFEDTRHAYQVTQLWVMDRDGGNVRSLTPDLDRDVESPAWTGDGSGLWFQYDDHGDTKIGLVSLDGEVREAVSGLGGLSLGRPYSGAQFSVAANGRLAYTRGDPGRPADLAMPDSTDGRSGRITDVNGDLFAIRPPGAVEKITVPSSFDGRPIDAWIVTPPGFDPTKSYPLVLEIHGGPHTAYGPHFSMECQLYAAAGYVVVYANPRGSTSYGGEFGNLIHHAYPSEDYDDLMSCVDAVIARGSIDEERLYVTGGSGGGVLSAWIVGKTNRFRAAVVAKPVIDWASFALTSDGYPYYVRYWFPGPPWEAHEEYWRRSPLSLVGNVSTPTMLLTGEEDHRTPISQSEQYYQALKLRGVDTALVRIPGASHGIAARPSQLMAKVAHVLGWFRRHGGEELPVGDR